MSIDYEKFFDELKLAVEEDRIILPSLPEVALKIREVVDHEDTTTEQIADILSQDAALSVRLLKVVNSPLYGGAVPIDDLKIAVTRLGGKMVRDLITNLAMKQIFKPTSWAMEKQFRHTWSVSVNVAAICQMMTASMCGIRREQALLAGLIHNIGALPLLAIAGNDEKIFNDAKELNAVIHALQGRVGAMMLESWNFSSDMIEVVAECHNFDYEQNDGTNLVNLVQVALLQGGYVAEQYAPFDWCLVPAFSRLGMDSEVNILQIKENQLLYEKARQSLLV